MKKQFSITKFHDNYSIRRYLRTQFPHLSQDTIHKSLRNGDIRVNNMKVGMDCVLYKDDIVAIWEMLLIENESNEIDCVSKPHEYAFLKPLLLDKREDLWCFNKPSGLAMQGGTGLKTNMNYLVSGMMHAENVAYKPHIVHRLDKGTSGCCLFATNSMYASALTKLFAIRAIKKHYIAICQYMSSEKDILSNRNYGIIDHNIDGQEAITEYKLEYTFTIDTINNEQNKQVELALISFFPKTGRKHQIRKHAASLNWPILGDDIYNISDETTMYPSMCLHAKAISYNPINQTKDNIAMINTNVNIEAFHYNAEMPIHMTRLLPK